MHVPATSADQNYTATTSFTDFGESVLITEDFDGDGWRDIMIGAVAYDIPAPPGLGGSLNNVGAGMLFSSQTGALIRTYPGFQPEGSLGFDIVELPDRNSDGIVDFAMGAPRMDNVQPDEGGFVVFSGADASVIGGGPGTLGNSALMGWSLTLLASSIASFRELIVNLCFFQTFI